MKRKMLALFTIAFVLTLVVSGVALADAVDEEKIKATETEGTEAIRASNYLSAYSVGITAQGGNKMAVNFNVSATRLMNKVGVLQIIIERDSGNGWVHDSILYHYQYPNFIRLNAMQNMSSVTFTGIKNCRYRATITAYAADANGADYKSSTSGSAICY